MDDKPAISTVSLGVHDADSVAPSALYPSQRTSSTTSSAQTAEAVQFQRQQRGPGKGLHEAAFVSACQAASRWGGLLVRPKSSFRAFHFVKLNLTA